MFHYIALHYIIHEHLRHIPFGSISTVRDEGRRGLLRVKTYGVCAIFTFLSSHVTTTRDRICRLPRFNQTRIVGELVSSGIPITLYYTTLHYITSHYTSDIPSHYITLHYITLHYTSDMPIALHYTTLHYVASHYTSGIPNRITLHYITADYQTGEKQSVKKVRL